MGMSLYDYRSVKIGTTFRGLTLKIKGQEIPGKRPRAGNWFVKCVCLNELWMKRHEIVSGKRVTCGKCTARKVYRRLKKQEDAQESVREHFEVAGFNKVERRKHPNGSVWLIFRRECIGETNAN